MITPAFQILFIILIPTWIYYNRKNKIIQAIGMVGIAYGLGFIFSLFFMLLEAKYPSIKRSADVGEIGSYLCIALAIPLLLFSVQLKKLRYLSKKVLVSFLCLCASVIVVSVLCTIFFSLDQKETFGGMAIGLYTGGTPNLNTIGSFFKLDALSISVSNISDMLIGGVFYILVLFCLYPVLKRFLPNKEMAYVKENIEVEKENANSKKTSNLVSILFSFLCAVISSGIGILIWVILGSVQGKMMDYLVPSLLIGVTVLGLVGSFIPFLNQNENSSKIGEFLIVMFSFALASVIDFKTLNLDHLEIFLFFTCVTFISSILHIILCKIFKIDARCCIITMIAGIYGPAFVPAVSKQIEGDDTLCACGLICGSFGYAIGTFLGIVFVYLFRIF